MDSIKNKIDIKSMYLEEIEDDFLKRGYPKYKAKQVFKWLSKGAISFGEMSDLSKDNREELSKIYCIPGIFIEKKYVSQVDGTIKYLFRLDDGDFIESVLMKYKHGYSICVSTQVGCKMGCTFCATGRSGFSRNLRASEILSQIYMAQIDNNIRISNIVLMGMGEPLDNYDNVVRFLKLVSCKEGVNIGLRHISLSTCGVVDKIYKLSKEKLPITLSVSLHAPNDDIRSITMPINKKWGIDSLLAACKEYIKETNRRVSFEYAMIKGLNDTNECAKELGERLYGMLCHVNLILVNEVQGTKYKKSEKERVEKFISILSKKGLNVTVRRKLGYDINASCGQLKRSYFQGKENTYENI